MLGTLAPGASSSLDATSDSFGDNKDRSVTLLFATSSSDTDYSPPVAAVIAEHE